MLCHRDDVERFEVEPGEPRGVAAPPPASTTVQLDG
jgi:hypothetical protein